MFNILCVYATRPNARTVLSCSNDFVSAGNTLNNCSGVILCNREYITVGESGKPFITLSFASVTVNTKSPAVFTLATVCIDLVLCSLSANTYV